MPVAPGCPAARTLLLFVAQAFHGIERRGGLAR